MPRTLHTYTYTSGIRIGLTFALLLLTMTLAILYIGLGIAFLHSDVLLRSAIGANITSSRLADFGSKFGGIFILCWLSQFPNAIRLSINMLATGNNFISRRTPN